MKNLELQKKAKLLEALVNDLCEETSAEQTYERLLALGTDIGITDEDLKDWGFNPFEDEDADDKNVSEDEEFDANYQPDWRLDIAGWHIDKNHRLVISDSAAAFNFKVGRIIVIEFLDIWGDRQDIGRYKIIDNDSCEITCEKLA